MLQSLKLLYWTKMLFLIICITFLTNNLFGLYLTSISAAEIIKDGLTETSISSSGDVIDINTSTIKNNNAFNSFEKFNLDAEKTANLFLPENASNLVNLIHGSRSDIYGRLNSIKDGQIGGHLYFLNPHGILIGKGASLNVGSLTALTPSQDYMESFFDSANSPNNNSVQKIIDGQVPITESGQITVKGEINAVEDINLQSGKFSNQGTVQSAAVFENSSDFSDVVNTNGLESGNQLEIEADGDIYISSELDIENSGNIITKGDNDTAAGNITIEAAENITLKNSSNISALNTGSAEGGNINITAAAEDSGILWQADAASSLEAGGTIKGNNIDLNSKAQADYDWQFHFDREKKVYARELGSIIVTSVTGLDVAYAYADADSKITIKDNADIAADSELNINADSTSNFNFNSRSEASGKKFSLSGLYGKISSDAEIEVEENALISAENLNIGAKNNTDYTALVTGHSFGGSFIEPTIVLSKADVNSQIKLDSDSKINVGEDINLSSFNNNSFETEATAQNNGKGVVGFAFARFDADTNAKTIVNTDLTAADNDGLDNLYITAFDNTEKNIVKANSRAGSGPLENIVYSQLKGQEAEKYSSLISENLKKLDPLNKWSGSDKTEKPKAAATFSRAITDQNAETVIGENSKIEVNNELISAARVKDTKIRNHTTSAVNSNKEYDAKNPRSKNSLSFSYSYGEYKKSAESILGDNAEISAKRLGLSSQVEQPYILDWNKGDLVTDIKDKLNTTAGMENHLTSYTNSTNSADNIGLFGSVNRMFFNNNSQSIIGRGAEINLKGDYADQKSWQSDLLSPAYGVDWQLNWDSPLSVFSDLEIQGVFAAGNYDLFLAAGGGAEDAFSLGGSYSDINYTGASRAQILEGAEIDVQDNAEEQKSGGVSLRAASSKKIITIAPTSGRGTGYGLNGVSAFGSIKQQTEASIDDEAQVSAENIEVKAESEVDSRAYTGAFNMSKNAGVGYSLAAQDIENNTAAFIGDNDSKYRVKEGDTLSKIAAEYRVSLENLADANNIEDPKLIKAGDLLTIPYSKGVVRTDDLDLAARSDGQIDAIAVGLAAASNADPADGPGFIDRYKQSLEDNQNKLIGWIGEKLNAKDQKPAQTPKFGIGVSGSTAYNKVNLDNNAYLSGAVIDLSENKSSLNLDAVNDTDIFSISGAGSLIMAKNPNNKFSTGIAGSYTYNEIMNSNKALIDDSHILGADKLSINSLNGGEIISFAAGLEVNISADQKKAGSAAGSASINEIENNITAEINDSVIEGKENAEQRNAELNAYDRTQIGSGGGSLTWGGVGGFGAAVTINKIENDIKASLSGTALFHFDKLAVHGISASRIIAGGAVFGLAAADESLFLNGSIINNQINNSTSAQIVSDSAVYTGQEVDILARDLEYGNQALSLFDQILDKNDGEKAEKTQFDYSGEAIFGDGLNYQVKKGDSLEIIADKYKVSEAEIRKKNSLNREEDISEGDELLIPIIEHGNSIFAGAGNFQVNPRVGSKNVGLSFAYNEIANDFNALIADSEVRTVQDKTGKDSINLNAISGSRITGFAVGVGLEGQFSGTGSLIYNDIQSEVRAEVIDNIESPHNQKTVLKSDNLNLRAEDNSSAFAFGGNYSFNLGQHAYGGAGAVNIVNNTTQAVIDTINSNNTAADNYGVSLDIDNQTIISALNNQHNYTSAAMTAVSDGISGNLSVSDLQTNNNTFAYLNNAETVELSSEEEADQSESKEKMTITAEDNSSVITKSGLKDAGGKTGAGISRSINRINNTTDAHLSSNASQGKYQLKDLLIESRSLTMVDNYTAAASGGLEYGAAGSWATNLINNTTKSYIDSGAVVSSDNNIAVIAETDEYITAGAGTISAGSTLGLGGSLVNNKIDNDTDAHISGNETSVTAYAADSEQEVEISDGVNFAEIAKDNGLIPEDYERENMQGLRKTKNVRGIAVNAVSNHNIENYSFDGSYGSSNQGSGTMNNNLILGDTRAAVVQAEVNTAQDMEASDEQSLNIKADDFSYLHAFVGDVGAGADSGNAAVNVNYLDRDTKAYLVNSNAVNAADSINVDALTAEVLQSTAGAGTIAENNLMGIGSFSSLHGSNTAYIYNSELNTNDLNINADRDAFLSPASGGVDLGINSAGGAYSVVLDLKKTKAYLEDTKLHANGDTDINASGSTEISNKNLSGAYAGGFGIAGGAVLSLIGNESTAYLKNSRLGNGELDRINNFNLNAVDKVKVDNRAGYSSVGIESLGVGGAASIIQVNNQSNAYLDNSKVYAEKKAEITSYTERDLYNKARSLGIGGVAGVSGTAAVTFLGRGIYGKWTDEFNKNSNGTLNFINDNLTNDDHLKIGENVKGKQGVSEEELAEFNSNIVFDITDLLYGKPETPKGTFAEVKKGSLISAGEKIKINAAERNDVEILAGAVEGGIFAGVGGTAAHIGVDNTVKAAVENGSHLKVDQGSIEINARAENLADDDSPAFKITAYQGSGSLVTLGGSYADLDLNNNLSAVLNEGSSLDILKSADEKAPSDVIITAVDKLALENKAYGFTGAGAEAGGVMAKTVKDGSAKVLLGDNSNLNRTIINADQGLINLKSSREGSVHSMSRYGAVGGLTVDGSGANAEDKGSVESLIDRNTIINAEQENGSTAASDLSLRAEALPSVKAEAYGFNGSSLNLSLSKASAAASTKINSEAAGGSIINADDLTISAEAGLANHKLTADSYAEAAGFGHLLGYDAAESTAESSINLSALLNSQLNLAGDLNLDAVNLTAQKSEARGVLKGTFTAGSNSAFTKAENDTEAALKNNTSGRVAGDINLSSNGTDKIYAYAESGSGGTAVKAAAETDLISSSKNRALIGGGSREQAFTSKNINLNTKQQTFFNSLVDSRNASVVGKSGGSAENNIMPEVSAAFIRGANISSGNVDINVNNIVKKEWLDLVKDKWRHGPENYDYNGTAASGGLINGPAVSSLTTISNKAQIIIGFEDEAERDERTQLRLKGNMTASAENNVEAVDKTKISAAGAVENPKAVSKINIKKADSVFLMENDSAVDAAGKFRTAVYTNADLAAEAHSKTYGLAGSAQGYANSEINNENRIQLKGNSSINSGGGVELLAGQNRDYAVNQLKAHANTDLYNKTAARIKKKPEADAAASEKNYIQLADGSEIDADADIKLLTEKADLDLVGFAKAKDLYQKIEESFDNFFRRVFHKKEVSLELRGGSKDSVQEEFIEIDGLINSANKSERRLLVDKDGLIDPADTTFGMAEKVINNNDDLIELGNIYTEGGSSIILESEDLFGAGRLSTAGRAEIGIENRSSKNLYTNEIGIGDQAGAKIYFNGSSVENLNEINSKNKNHQAEFAEIKNSGDNLPQISILNSYYDENGAGPDIIIQNNIHNLNGEVDIRSDYGSISMAEGAEIYADHINLKAGKNITINHGPGIYNSAGDPRERWSAYSDDFESGSEEMDDFPYVPSAFDIEENAVVAGNKVKITGEYININGLIQSGIEEHSLRINGLNQDGSIAKKGNIDVIYNAELDRFEMIPVNVGGGSLELEGHILSTGNGELKVMDGYGQIDVRNNSSRDLVLKNMNTGGNIDGRIKIIDKAGTGYDGEEPLTTVYKRSLNANGNYQIDQYSNKNSELDLSSPHKSYVVDNVDDQALYKPDQGQYYSWTKTEHNITDMLGNLKSEYITETDPEIIYKNPDNYLYGKSWYIYNRENNKKTVYKSGELYEDQQIVHKHDISGHNPVDIKFIGSAEGEINVTGNSAADLIIAGKLSNLSGKTNLSQNTTGKILTADNPTAKITGDQIKINANRDIGAEALPIKVELSQGGFINAQTSFNSDLNIEELKGSLYYDKISGRNVSLSAESGIYMAENSSAADSSPLISAVNIELNTNRGSIGSAEKALLIDSDLNNWGTGTVSAVGPEGVYLSEKRSSDHSRLESIYLDQIRAENGDVVIEADQIIDANPDEIKDQRSETEITELWGNLDLMGEDAEADVQMLVKSYENKKTQEYKDYWQLRKRQIDKSGNYLEEEIYNDRSKVALYPEEKDYYRNELNWNDDQIAELENELSHKLHSLNKEYGEVGSSYNSEWNYNVRKPKNEAGELVYDSSLYDSSQFSEWDSFVSGHNWTESQLRDYAGVGMFKEITDTRVKIEAPNIIAQNISLKALAEGGSIGSQSKQPLIIDLNQRSWSDLKQEEKEALMTAEYRDINYIDDYKAEIRTKDSLDISAEGEVNVSAGKNIFLASEEEIKLGRIQQSNQYGMLRIKSAASLLSSPDSSRPNIVMTGEDLVLESALESIGSAERKLSISSSGDFYTRQRLTARAGDDIFIESLQNRHPLMINTIYALDNVSLSSQSGFSKGHDEGLNIKSNTLSLDAGRGAIGSSGSHIEIAEIGEEAGWLELDADQGIYLSKSQGDINIDSLELTQGDLELSAPDGNITFSKLKTAAGDIKLDAFGSITNKNSNEESKLTAANIYLKSNYANIGSSQNSLEIDSSYNRPGVVTAEAVGDIYLTEMSGDFNADRLYSQTGDISILSQKSILNRGENYPLNFRSQNLSLHSIYGSLGEEDKQLTVMAGDKMDFSAYYNQYIEDESGRSLAEDNTEQKMGLGRTALLLPLYVNRNSQLNRFELELFKLDDFFDGRNLIEYETKIEEDEYWLDNMIFEDDDEYQG